MPQIQIEYRTLLFAYEGCSWGAPTDLLIYTEGAVQVFQQKLVNCAVQHLRELKQDPAQSNYRFHTVHIINVPIVNYGNK